MTKLLRATGQRADVSLVAGSSLIRHSDFVIPGVFVIRYSSLGTSSFVIQSVIVSHSYRHMGLPHPSQISPFSSTAPRQR